MRLQSLLRTMISTVFLLSIATAAADDHAQHHSKDRETMKERTTRAQDRSNVEWEEGGRQGHARAKEMKKGLKEKKQEGAKKLEEQRDRMRDKAEDADRKARERREEAGAAATPPAEARGFWSRFFGGESDDDNTEDGDSVTE